jgi:hypothetical protein
MEAPPHEWIKAASWDWVSDLGLESTPLALWLSGLQTVGFLGSPAC